MRQDRAGSSADTSSQALSLLHADNIDTLGVHAQQSSELVS